MDEALIREQEAAAAEDRPLLQAYLLDGGAGAVHGLLPVRRAPAAAVRHCGAHRQPVRPSGVAAAAPRVSGQRPVQRELCAGHRPADAGDGGHLCADGGGAGRCADRQGGLWRLRQLPLQPGRRGLCWWRRCPGRNRCSATRSPTPAIPLWDASRRAGVQRH